VTDPATSAPPPARRVGRPLFNLFFASFGYVAIRMVVAPVRIKLLTSLLSKDDYALLTLVMLTTSFITLVSSLGSLEFMLRKLPGRPPDFQFKTLRTLMTYFGMLAGFIGVAGAAALVAWQPAKLGLSTSDVLAAAVILVLSVHLNQIVYFLMGRSQYAQSRLLMLLYADAWFLPLLLAMGFMDVTVGFMLWLWAFWLLGSLLAAQAYVGFRRLLAARPSRPLLAEVLVFGIPLMPMIMGEWMFQVVDRYVLLAYVDLEAVANFTLCFNLAWVGAATGTSLLDVLITEFYKARNRVASKNLDILLADANLRRSFTLLLRYALLLGIPILLALWIARAPVVLLLSAPKFADAVPIMRWVAPIPFLYLLCVIAGRTLVAIDRGHLVGIATLCAAALHVALSIALVPRLAERGVALSGCIAYAALALYLGAAARIHRWIDWKELRPLRMILFALLSAAALRFAVASLGPRHLLALLLGGSLVLAAMFLLGLVHKHDVRHLVDSMHAPDDPSQS
jgi:O-antigen/teichoic acid export membrane protein